MSMMNLILAGVAGAALASGGWYAAGSSNEEPVEPAKTESPMMAIQDPCAEMSTHSIDLARAKDLVNRYLTSSNRLHYDNSSGILKGWFLERCVIEELFRKYSDSDGLQLYVGLNEDAANTLVWMASHEVNNSGTIERENIITDIQDMTSLCPINCPKVNDLP